MTFQKQLPADENKKVQQRMSEKLRFTNPSKIYYEPMIHEFFITQIILKKDLGLFSKYEKKRILNVINKQFQTSIESATTCKGLLLG